MRTEYTLNNFVSDFFDAIDDFMSNFSSIYSLLDSQTDRRVYRNILENLDVIFFSYVPDRILIFVVPLYDSTKYIWYQDEIVCNGYDQYIPKGSDIAIESYFYPAPTLYSGNKLVANYNTENNTFMFSVIRDIPINYVFTSAVIEATTNIVFGGTTKYLDFNGGFFYGGDHVYTYEGIVGLNDRFNNIVIYQDSSVDHGNYEGNDSPINKFEFILRAVIDNSLYYDGHVYDYIEDWTYYKGYLQWGYNYPQPLRRNLIRKCNWAITVDTRYYIKMICSLTLSTKKVPRYEPLLSHDVLERGNTNNTLNNISVIMPLWFMVRRDPKVLDEYSSICRNDIINFVNMYNMSTNKLENGTYPIKEHTYNCFQIGTRRSMVGMKGYSGIAFKQEGEEDGSSVDNLDLFDLGEMENHIEPNETTPILNIEVGGKSGYGGDTHFTDMPDGSFILKHPYTDYSSIVFEFCDDSGTVTDTVTWSKTDLDNAFNGSVAFNLLPADSPVTWAGSPGSWEIEPFSNGSNTTKFLCSYQNCGLIGAKGIM